MIICFGEYKIIKTPAHITERFCLNRYMIERQQPEQTTPNIPEYCFIKRISRENTVDQTILELGLGPRRKLWSHDRALNFFLISFKGFAFIFTGSHYVLKYDYLLFFTSSSCDRDFTQTRYIKINCWGGGRGRG